MSPIRSGSSHRCARRRRRIARARWFRSPRAFQRLMFDVVSVGHVARDEFEGEPDWRLGGTALYAAAAGARLGARVALLTRVGPGERERLESRCRELAIELHALEGAVTTTFAFRYVDGRRRLRLKARAKGIAADAIPAALRDTRSVVLASIAHEIEPSMFEEYGVVRRVLAAQGYLRSRDAGGTGRRRERRAARA